MHTKLMLIHISTSGVTLTQISNLVYQISKISSLMYEVLHLTSLLLLKPRHWMENTHTHTSRGASTSLYDMRMLSCSIFHGLSVSMGNASPLQNLYTEFWPTVLSYVSLLSGHICIHFTVVQLFWDVSCAHIVITPSERMQWRQFMPSWSFLTNRWEFHFD